MADNLAAQTVAEYLQNDGMKLTLMGENNEVIRVVFNADNRESIEVKLFFDEDNHSVAVRSFDLCKVPENKKPAVYEACSKLNDQFRWVKFYIDESDNTVTAACDAVLTLETAGKICDELIYRTVHIVDDGYPDLMKSLWA